MRKASGPGDVDRRRFLQTAAAAGLVLTGQLADNQAAENGADTLQIGLVGAGTQGQFLLNLCAKLSNVRIKALCDVWSYNRDRAAVMLGQYGHQHNAYASCEEMLAKENDLDAVLIATPDCFHAQQTVACLKAGAHVYCETPMAITVESAREMAGAASSAGKLLQIGYQRRSNPYYLFSFNHVINETKLLGEIVAANGQWNRPQLSDRRWPRRSPVDDAELKRLGFESMLQFRNWQWFEGLGGGPLLEFGSHQIDIFNWFLESVPKAGYASGGVEYYDPESHQHADTSMAILQYPAGEKTIRAFYQSINSNSNSGYFESFMGDQGTLYVSDSEAAGRVKVFREPSVRDWDKWIRVGYLKSAEAAKPKSDDDSTLEVAASAAPPSYSLAVEASEPSHQLHLQNFFQSIRGEEALNCPAEVAYSATVVALQLAAAARSSTAVTFRPEDFQI